LIYRRLARVRPFVQAAALLAFFALLLATRRDAVLPLPANLFFRLDPLAALAAMVAARAWIAPLALSLVVVALTLLTGRTWCGWLCPLGTLLDLFGPRRHSSASRRSRLAPATRWRRVKDVLLLALLGAALLGSLVLLPLDPITLLTRTLAAGLLPLLNLGLVALEARLYGVPALQGAVEWLAALRSSVLPVEQVAYWPAVLLVVALLGIVALNRIAPRFWCRYLCPLGALLGWLSRPAVLRRAVTDECSACRRCLRSCPMGTVDPARGFQSDPAECTVCLDCVVDCPQQAARFGLHTAPAAGQPYDPSRRQALASIAVGIGGAALFNWIPRSWQVADTLIRPPGAQGAEFWGRCIRCGECMKICPTSGLQPVWWQSGPDGVGTPVLVPRTGYCDYSCHSCGQVCPTGAIRPLTLEEKREAVIGVAVIDRDRCLPWAEATPCIVCEEMCPIPDKAIDLEEAEAVDSSGERVTVQRPHIVAERCIGCGICEFKCPLEGVAAVRVTS
jgi:MauM/NapG family ferredoxin protein